MRRSLEKLAVPAAALVVGVGGALSVQKALESSINPEQRAKLDATLQPAAKDIGSMVLDQMRIHPGTVSVEEKGDWGGPTLTFERKSGYIQVGMDRKKGKLNASTTYGVWVERPAEPDTLRGGYISERVVLESGDENQEGVWSASGELLTNGHHGLTVSIEVNKQDPNLTNAYTASEKATEIAQEVLGLIIPPSN